ncbi:hypothetical protein [Propionibacterium australiense]|uniref:hypothetical protein n=1 Tax=Propionibacterium australiense TaxID=119981 RepID=UPI000F84502C|nr:hypothetical protein [Propionibacterium australiense]
MAGYDYVRADSFMEKIVEGVYRPAISDTIRSIEDPPGREPLASLVVLSEWYSTLSDQEKEMLRGVAVQAADAALFGGSSQSRV